MTEVQQQPAGWYPNPEASQMRDFPLRWWTGEQWSELLQCRKRDKDGTVIVRNGPAGRPTAMTLEAAIAVHLSGDESADPWIVEPVKTGFGHRESAPISWAAAVLEAIDKQHGYSKELDQRAAGVMRTLHIKKADVAPQLWHQVTLGRIECGWVTEISDTGGLILHAGEKCYSHATAGLVHEKTLTQFRGGSAGISIPLGKTGVRLRTGQFRGHQVEVGTELHVDDSGPLVVTSQRIVFVGKAKSIEFALAKLSALNLDGRVLRIAVTGRQSVSQFQFPTRADAETVSAMISWAAAQGS